MGLQNHDRVAVVGGGPSGSLFAICLLREARRLSLDLDVVIVERRNLTDRGAESFQCKGCNFCAGVISPRMNQVLDQLGLVVPDEIIEERLEYVWIQGQWKNFRLRVPGDMKMYSVFRGSLPGRRTDNSSGFDAFLLRTAAKEGARIQFGEAQAIAPGASGNLVLTVRTPAGERQEIAAAFVAFATGINARPGAAVVACSPGSALPRAKHTDEGLLASIQRLNPAFVPSRSRKAFIFELEVGKDYLERNLHREAHFIESGSRQLELEHAALLPKRGFLTVAMIGNCIDQAVLPRDSRQMIHDFLTLPQIARILPGITAARVSCACAPRMTDKTARSPFGDRFAIIGDAAGSRLNKDGLYSAYVTASRLAHVLLHDGIDRQALARGYGKAVEWLATDNRFGRVVFAMSRVAFARSLVSRVTYQAFATEQKVRDECRRPLSGVLWKIASGTADYRQVLREMLRPRVLGSLLTGAAVTARNVLCESCFGLKWGEFGRYPTVVLKEQREKVKRSLATGVDLDGSPEFERMYVIKIRGSADEILAELASFGKADASFLNLRFLQVRHIRGEPNQVGSVIRYRLAGLGAEMRLTKRVGNETLLYSISEELTEQGKLIFHLAPTKDKNIRLAIYTAFNYKRGRNWASRILWRMVKLLFPEFAHDVVWNHALCTIKEEVERTGVPGKPDFG